MLGTEKAYQFIQKALKCGHLFRSVRARTIVIGPDEGSESDLVQMTLADFVEKLALSSFCVGKTLYDAKPWSVIVDTTAEALTEVKRALLARGISFNDGYEHVEFSFGVLAQDANIVVTLDGDKFFGKHIAVVGATGSGKSCTVAKILQEGIAPSSDQRSRAVLNNAHIIIFDIHGEYGPAFPTAVKLSIDNLALPYWLLNSEELEEMFIESGESNSYNQASMFKRAVTLPFLPGSSTIRM